MALPSSDAKNYLDKWITNEHDGASAEDVLEMLTELARLVDEEYAPVSLASEEKLLAGFEGRKGDEETLDADYDQAVFTLRRDRLANWTLLLAGLQTALANTEQDRSLALQDFRASLIDLTRQHPGTTAFNVKPKAKILPTDELWARARVIAAYGLFSGEREKTLRKGAALLGLTQPQTRKIISNFGSGREPRADLTNLVELAKLRSSDGTFPDLDALLYPQ